MNEGSCFGDIYCVERMVIGIYCYNKQFHLFHRLLELEKYWLKNSWL